MKTPFYIRLPTLLKEWDFQKNLLCPEKISSGSKKKVWWKCDKEHSWLAIVNNRVSKLSGCPYCSNHKVGYGNDLLTNHPELCQEWDFEKNKLGPENYTPGSEKKVWWKCALGHSFRNIIHNRALKGRACPYCSNQRVGYGNDLLTNHPELCKEWDYEKNTFSPEKTLFGSSKKVWWKCSEGHSWKTAVNKRTMVDCTSCPVCSVGSISRISQKWLDSLGVEQREVKIGRFRVDGFDPKTNTVYEFLGDYWHGNPKIFSAGKINPSVNKTFGQLYHKTKERIFRLQKLGYKVVYIWENEWRQGLSVFHTYERIR